jgi:hypothetical protein
MSDSEIKSPEGKIKKERSSNWTLSEKTELVYLITPKLVLLEGSFQGDTVTNEKKTKAWVEIAATISARRGIPRTWKQCREKWRKSRGEVKKLVGADDKEKNKTGGGPPPSPKVRTEFEDKVATLYNSCPSFRGINGGVDTCRLRE